MRTFFEHFFGQLAKIVTKHDVLVISGMTALVILLCLPLMKIRVDSSIEYYLKDNDPSLIAYKKFKNLFGSDERIVLGIRSPNIFSAPFLEKLRALHNSLASGVPYTQNVSSILSAPIFKSDKDSIIVNTLLDSWPETPEAFNYTLNFIRTAPLYRNRFYTHDELFAILTLSIDSQADPVSKGLEEDVLSVFDTDLIESNSNQNLATEPISLGKEKIDEVVNAVHTIVNEHQDKNFQIYPTGLPIYNQFVRQTIKHDTLRFISFSTIAIALVLFLLLRRLSGVILPFIVVFSSIASTMGLMALFNRPMKTPTTILPSFLMAVGIGACVHVMTLFYIYQKKSNSRQEAIASTLSHSGFAITITSLTTAAGLFSFSMADVAPVADLGLFAGLGVLLSYLYAIIFLPALLSIIPIKTSHVSGRRRIQNGMRIIIDWFARFSVSHTKSIIFGSVLILSLAFVGIAKLKLSHNPLHWMPENTPIRRSTEIIDKHLKGLINVEIMLDTERDDGFKSLEILQRLDQLKGNLNALSTQEVTVGNTASIADMIKHAHWSLNNNKDQAYRIPDDPKMLAQELLLLETGSPNFPNEWVDTSYRIGRMTLYAPWVDAVSYGRFIEKIENRCQKIFSGLAKITITGNIPLLARTLHATMQSMIKSYVLAGVAITLMMILLIGKFKIGCLSMLPNLLPILIAIGIIGWIGMPMDMYTMLVGSIALGIAVDDTVHFMYHFHRYHSLTNDVSKAVSMTMQTAGHAMLTTSMVLTVGASVFLFSTITSLQNFGLITGITIILALLSDFLLAPAIMACAYGGEKAK